MENKANVFVYIDIYIGDLRFIIEEFLVCLTEKKSDMHNSLMIRLFIISKEENMLPK